LVFWGLLAVSRASVLAAFLLCPFFIAFSKESASFVPSTRTICAKKRFYTNFFYVQTNEQVDVIIYRVRENGLEVFLVDQENDGSLIAPLAGDDPQQRLDSRFIELDPVSDPDGVTRKAIAIEADWHEIPSLRALIYEDYRVAKEKARSHLMHLLTNFEKGTYVAVKEAVKRVMPAQYAFLKELKDIIADKNQANSI
jgi:hypothetical protein